MGSTLNIAVIGAGITGMHLAREVSDIANVTVFDKSRGVGGRMSTRRTEAYQFDHGAQYFTAHSDRFHHFLAPYIKSGVVAPWAPHIVELDGTQVTPLSWTAQRYVAVPGMTALAKTMADGIEVIRNTRITGLEQIAEKWYLASEQAETFGPFDWVISTAPQPQTLALLPETFSQIASLGAVKMQGCYSLMLGFAERPDISWDAAVVKNSPLAWIALNGGKPERKGTGSILCQSGNDWADAHLEDDQAAVQNLLSQEFQNVTGVDVAQADYVSLHRWRYAKVTQPTTEDYLIDVSQNLAAAGDWCGGGRVEAGFESAAALADQLRMVMQA